MNPIYRVFEKVASLFRRKGKGGRRWRRELINLSVAYNSTNNELVVGGAQVLDISTGGVSLAITKPVAVGEMLALRLNPHAVQKHIGRVDLATDFRGRYLAKVQWVREITENESYQVGCAFLKKAPKKSS